MAEDKVKIKNCLMERLYEKVSHKLESINTYEIAKNTLFSTFKTFDNTEHTFSIRTSSNEEKCEIIIDMKESQFSLIQLYLGEQNTYYLSISVPNQNDNVEEQIIVAKGLITHLSTPVKI